MREWTLSNESAYSALLTDEENNEEDEEYLRALDLEMGKELLKDETISSYPLLEQKSTGSWRSIPKEEKEPTKSFSAFSPIDPCVFQFPSCLENCCRPFDDCCVNIVQFTNNKFLILLCNLITAGAAIEIIFTLPFILYGLGFDGLGNEITYLALATAIVSQVPKRFIWRYRPWMVQRAMPLGNAKTSSFPSRAVCCGVVYVFMTVYAYCYYTSVTIELWMPLYFLVIVCMISFARVYLGVHYASDCAFGMLQGLIICALGTGFSFLEIWGCSSCRNKECYSDYGSEQQLTASNLIDMSLWPFLVAVILSLAFTILAGMKPVRFWTKCDRALGLLLPCVAFQLGFLCPNGSQSDSSLADPVVPPPLWAYPFAVIVPLFLIGLTVKLKSKYTVLSFMILYSITLGCLVTWRLFCLPYNIPK